MSVAAPERVDLPVSGMTCASCARTIERTLANTAGVERARVNLATNTATIEYWPDLVHVADFIAAIEDLGYGVPKTAARPDAQPRIAQRRGARGEPFPLVGPAHSSGGAHQPGFGGTAGRAAGRGSRCA